MVPFGQAATVTYGPNVNAAAILLGSAGNVPVDRTATGDGGPVGVSGVVRVRRARP
jgi:transposase